MSDAEFVFVCLVDPVMRAHPTEANIYAPTTVTLYIKLIINFSIEPLYQLIFLFFNHNRNHHIHDHNHHPNYPNHPHLFHFQFLRLRI